MSILRHHNDWLRLVPNSGPFLSLPVLAQAFPQGLDAHDPDHARRLRMAFAEWDDNQLGHRPDPAIHRAWIKLVLGETLGFKELLAEGQEIPQTLKSDVAEYGVTLKPDWIVNDPATKKARLLMQVYPRSQSLTKPVASSRWKTSPDTRMMQLLHDTGIRLGIVTNGDHWMLVNAPKNETTGYASWYANLWLEEPVTLRAFRTLLSTDRFFSVPENETLDLKDGLLDQSSKDQQEVTDQLGYQVRKAVEVLIQALDKADQDHGRKLLADVDEKVLYESALTVMMRLVFLFCAEERGLIPDPTDKELYDRYYAASTLRESLRVTADQFGEEILGLRYDAWTRLLSTFRAVYAGAKHDRLKLPPYGGSLFNPDRFPFLEGRKLGTSWKEAEAAPLPVNNRTVLHLLESLQTLETKLPGAKEVARRKLSFRSLDIEQIGHVYEGLLDHTAKRATEPVLGLAGTRDKEPEIALAELEKLLATEDTEITEGTKKSEPPLSVSSVTSVAKFLTKLTGRAESALKKGLNAELDDQLVSRFRTACQDSDLWKRVKPFAGLVRLDDMEYPVVITTGSVFVTAGTDRRSSGTHYTPKSLTEPIVQYTLEPLVFIGPAEGLPREQWKLRSAKELLALKICDMACGSGAFLVQACRYMSARLLEAWDVVQRANPGTLRITPEGQPSSGQPGEMLIPDDPDERQTYALRIVAQRCLYGVDKNPLAAEMAKLSLWLLTLAKDKPFEFLDHAIRCGDSLVGIHNLDQLRKFNLDGKGEDNSLFLQFLDPKIKEAIALRRQITEMQANTVEDVEAQDRMLREANEKIDRLKCAADFLIAAEFSPGSAADKRAARDDAAIKVAVHFNDSDLPTFRREAQKALAGQVTFHWPLEFPEVMVERGGFDGFVGNPPFMGGQKITGNSGVAYRDYLIQQIANDRRGSADLCSYFFLRASASLRPTGQFGLVATNTIAQGDTREVGLDHLANNGFDIPRAIPSRKWPGIATVEVAYVWVHRGTWGGAFTLNDVTVPGITSFLSPTASVVGNAFSLVANHSRAFKGTVVLGMGFVLTPDEAKILLDHDIRYKDVLFPYLNGQELNSSPTFSPPKWGINFFDWPLDRTAIGTWQTATEKRRKEYLDSGKVPADYPSPVAEDYPRCLERVAVTVKPEREANRENNSTALGRAKRWWWFGRLGKELYQTIEGMDFVLVRSQTSKTQASAIVPSKMVFDQKLVVFAASDFATFAAIDCSLHYWWAIHYGSSLRTDAVYTPSDCYETYPFMDLDRQGRVLKSLEHIGRSYYEQRTTAMLGRQEGLTKTYNRFHDPAETSPDIQKLRQLHVEMDNAVTAAYGWTDLDLGHGFHETKQGVRYTISEPARREVLARLLKLNHERYAEEVKQGLHEKKKPRNARQTRKNTPEKPGLYE